MSYTSLQYYILVIISLLIYYIFPKKKRWIVLLVASIVLYCNLIAQKSQLILFCISIIISFTFAYIIDSLIKTEVTHKRPECTKRIVLFIGIVLTTLPLATYKLGDLINGSIIHKGKISWIIPIGLSFYTLQSIAYLVDVYKGKIRAEKNPFKYVLFISFFPQIIQGPIPRYELLAGQLYEGHKYDLNNIIRGIQLVIWGFFLKYMLADKAAIIVDTVFDHYLTFSGGYIWLAAFLYSLQLYTDFQSCVMMSRGVAEMFGIKLEDNFRHPYFSTSIREFWRRWHISLSKWLKDYIYIPLGGNKRGRIRKYVNLLITFTISGIWHGGQFNYLAWGLLHAGYQIIGELTHKMRNAVYLKLKVDPTGTVCRFFRTLITFFLAMIGWIIFRAYSLKVALLLIYNMFTDFNPWIWFDDSIFRLGLNWKEFIVLLISLFILFFVSYAQEKGISLRNWINSQNIAVRWGIYLIAIWTIWIFGSYGFGFEAKDFIYGGF